MKSVQQQYWVRRSRRLAACRQVERAFKLQKKMATQSNMPLLDVKLTFTKSQKTLIKSESNVKHLHTNLTKLISGCLDSLPTDKPKEEDLVKVFGDRVHTSSSELYFWEDSYNVLKQAVIQIDEVGRARIFESVSTQHETTNLSGKGTTEDVKRWTCSQHVCNMKQTMIDGVLYFFHKICETKAKDCCVLYTREIDNCTNESRSDKLGHPLHCCFRENCESLLRPARILSCHFPFLRNIVHRTYELRRLSHLVLGVRSAMLSGDYDSLKAALAALQTHINRTDNTNNNEDDMVCSSNDNVSADESTIMARHGKALHEVTEIRDKYATKACDVCEQLRTDLKSLKAYDGTKGFNSDKMTLIVEQLYQNKTKHEDIEAFMADTFICKYCADK